jgi:tRNA (adenine22-N1)-methyltransferase
MKTKLSQRLQDLFAIVDDSYQEAWDLCCDHGKLGLAFLEAEKTKKVYFVDQVSSIISKLKRKIENIEQIEPSQYELLLLKAEDIKIKDKRSLICICGVGGDVAINILKKISKKNDLRKHDILVSAQYHMFELRNFLKTNGFKAKKELLSFDGKWGYELLLLNLCHGKEVEEVGRSLFNKEDSRHLLYVNKIIKHYKNKSLKDESYAKILALYENLLS